MNEKLKNPTWLLQKLLQCKSITPCDDGAQNLITIWLEALGFTVTNYQFEGILNLYATRGTGSPHILFAGHTDVVSTPQIEDWKHAPFAGIIENNHIFGRGAQDMKGGIASFIAAIANIKADEQIGTISLAITGDEEASGINGTVKLLKKLNEQGEKWNAAIVGEPTCKEFLGDIIKIGRRGSLTGTIVLKGVSGHVAYPEHAQNAATNILPYLVKLASLKLDEANANFQASNLELTQILSGGEASNVIPGHASAKFNIRFNDIWNLELLKNHIEQELKSIGNDITINWDANGSESFITKHESLINILQDAIKATIGKNAKLDTGGGTSDARFVKNYCPVVEFGLCGTLMHKVNENVNLDELAELTKIYYNFLKTLDKL